MNLAHLRHNLPVIRSVAAATLSGLWPSSRRPRPRAEIRTRVPGPPPALVRDYLAHLGVEPSRDEGRIPPHLFPQWCFPAMATALRALPFPIHRVLNAGCRLELDGAIPAGEPLVVRACIDDVDEAPHRALIKMSVETGPEAAPSALRAEVTLVIPLARGSGERKEPPRVPAGATELARWRLGKRAGLEYALLAGDFNLIHWLWPAARLVGLPGVLLQGYSAMARMFEAVAPPQGMRSFEVRFVRPIVLPTEIGCWGSADGALHVGAGPGEVAVVTGRWG